MFIRDSHPGLDYCTKWGNMCEEERRVTPPGGLSMPACCYMVV